MRRLVCIVIVASALLTPAAAQDPQAILTDPAGDVRTSLADSDIPVDIWSTLDLRRLQWDEAIDRFSMTLTLEDLDAPREVLPGLDQVEYQVRFQYGHAYQVSMVRTPLIDSVSYRAVLEQRDPTSGEGAVLEELELLVDADAGTISTTFPKARIEDMDGKTPRVGDVIQDIHVVSRSVGAEAVSDVADPASMRAVDRMPDTGAASWNVTYGIRQSGDVRLDSPRPVRASNGEGTTYIYTVTVSNLAATPDTVHLKARDPPPNWVVTFPQERIRLEADDAVEIPILITVPFAHSHGTYMSVVVDGHSQRDPESVGRIELGVRYTQVPQPAGHHDTLWIHGSDTGLYVNTMEDDDEDAGTPAPAESEAGTNAQTRFRWWAPLLPPLEMGLDFDTGRTGTIEAHVEMPAGGLQTQFRGALVIQREQPDAFSDGDDTVLAEFESPAVDVLPGETRTFRTNLTPLPTADRVAWEDGTNLVLAIEVSTTGAFGTSVTPAGPSIHPGTSIQLPLDEFHDEVSGYFSTLSGIDMWAPDGQQRLANPGDAVVFRVTAENLADEQASYDLRLSGTNADWAEIPGDRRISIASGGTENIHIGVVVPADAADGERADVTLHAEDTDDPNVRSLVRFLIEVDTDAQHPDDAARIADLRETPSKQSPVAGWTVSLAVAVAFLAGIRHRGA